MAGVLALGIETSCDETAAAVVRDGREILSNVVASQVARHRRFGGVVPEIAAREHVLGLGPVVMAALAEAGVSGTELDLVAVTDRPGLQSALLAGVAAAEALGVAFGLPVVGVNHIEAHVQASFLAAGRRPEAPFVALVVSGGHTHLFHVRGPGDHRVLGATIDDAAGEAFDKVAKILGLGFPGGPAVERAAQGGDAKALRFKRPGPPAPSLDFSFSGLKTAVLYTCFGHAPDGRPGKELRPDIRVEDVAAAFQAAVVDVLDEKLRLAVEATGARLVAVGGGVACNGVLRARLAASAAERGVEILHAPPALCSDNAAMVAARGTEVFLAAGRAAPEPCVSPRVSWPRVG